ncbi:F0F1 ATP synthase subunit B [Alishewanella sp. SMS9]|nr:F0F1 ATP synthase subunit B [Alishewanella sp. SMS9]
MLIDWFTVVAQVINFLILAWLLKRFLYRPIVDAIDTRDRHIAAQVADANNKKIDAQKLSDKFNHKNTVFDEALSSRMKDMNQHVQTKRTQLLEEIRAESELLRTKQQQTLQNELLSVQQALSQHAKEEVFDITRKTLKDLANVDLEQQMTAVFIERLNTLSDKEIKAFTAAFANAAQPLVIRSVFTLGNAERLAIETQLKQWLSISHEIEYITDNVLISGIELSGHGQKIAWSINQYLASLTHSVEQLLQKNTTASLQTHEQKEPQTNEH